MYEKGPSLPNCAIRNVSVRHPTADMRADVADRRFGPVTVVVRRNNSSLDYLVGVGEQARRDVQTLRVGDFEVDHQLPPITPSAPRPVCSARPRDLRSLVNGGTVDDRLPKYHSGGDFPPWHSHTQHMKLVHARLSGRG